MNRILICLFFIVIVLMMHIKLLSQVSLGFEIIYNINSLNEGESYLPNTLFKPGHSLGIAIPIRKKINSHISLSTGLYYISKNYAYQRTGYYSGVYHKFKNRYLKIPILLSLDLAYKRFLFLFSGGIYGAYWISAKSVGKFLNLYNSSDSTTSNGRIINYANLEPVNQITDFNSQKDNRFEWGSSVGFKLLYHVRKNGSIYLSTTYDHSFSDQQKNYMMNQKSRLNRTVSFSIGIEKIF